MELLYQDLMRVGSIQTMLEYIELDEIINLFNLNDSFKAVLTGLIFKEKKARILYVTESDLAAQKVYERLEKILKDQVVYFPAKPVHDYFADVHSPEINHQRLSVMEKLLTDENMVVVLGAETLLKKQMPKDEFKRLRFTLTADSTWDPFDLVDRFVELGYEAVYQVEAKGQFSHRGGMIDVFSPTAVEPIRIEFWGDAIESLRYFDSRSQLSLRSVDQVSILPAKEIVLSGALRTQAFAQIKKRYEGEGNYHVLLEQIGEDLAGHDEALFPFTKLEGELLDYVGDACVIWDEPPWIKESYETFVNKVQDDFETLMEQRLMLSEEKNKFFPLSRIERRLKNQTQIRLHLFHSRGKKGLSLDLNVKENESFFGRMPSFLEFVKKQLADQSIIHLRARDEAGREKLKSLLVEADIHRFTSEVMPGIQLSVGEMMGGFSLPSEKIICINQSEIIRDGAPRKKRHRHKGKKIDTFTQLNPGDYVVHDTHGIGVYCGIEQLKIGDSIKDLMLIEYAKDAKFYCPVDQLDAIQVYVGTGEKKPKINQLGTNDWSKSKSRAKAALEEMADELIALYAKRQNMKGHAFGPDTNWQQEFEEAFPFEETDDQLLAVDEIKADMEAPHPMDRLLCGDVGYGKTEVALRAVFKAVMEGKQVAFLTPTTILAQQHYQTVLERFKKYPVRIGLLSRFKTKAEQELTIRALKTNQLDLVVGTHRLLSKDVVFSDLGLLVVDEEQRFGVRDKERIKQLKESVDVLTLSATPIPRTLHMSMIGVRDMSVIDEPPAGRRPVLTYVSKYNEAIIRDAIERELARSGQVYFVHNRIHDIFEVANGLQKLVPPARVVVAHGRMTGLELEDIMVDFLERKCDILVTTTIIESGLDIKNANTLIIDNGDHMGLSQLYQLRGRVGRSEVQGYAYVTHRTSTLTEVSQKRLKAIKDFTAFGSGFKIALRDLEIRGAGNILGSAQSGNLTSIGYELYCRILDGAIQERLGKEADFPVKEFNINLGVSGYIPENYISDEALKYDIYKKLSYVKTREDYKDLEDELLDRFGEIPDGVYNLMTLAMIKHLGRTLGMTEIREKGNAVLFIFDNKEEVPILDFEWMETLFKVYNLKLNAGKADQICWRITLKHDGDEAFLNALYAFIEHLVPAKECGDAAIVCSSD